MLYYIAKYTPQEKRLAYVENINRDVEVWKNNDELVDYNKETSVELMSSISECVLAGSTVGGVIGGIFGAPGKAVGSVIGGFVGGVVGFFKGLFS